MPLPRFPLFLTSLTALAALASIATTFADPIPATSTITAATVYADRAIVTRTARIELPAGQSELIFSNLPVRIFDNSIQVAGRGTAATILDVVARTTYTTVAADPRVKTLEDELTALTRQDRTLEDKLAVVYQQQGLLTKIETAVTQPASASKDSAAARPTFDDWQKLLAFSADNATRTAADRQSLEQQREELARKIAATKASLVQLGDQTPVHHAAKTVTVRVAVAQAGPLDLTLDYAVPGAAWGPDYTARLHSEKREIELTYFGQVINATGEDWNTIALTLSTARPNLGAGAPELSPWIVDAPAARAYSDSNGFSLLSKKPKRPSPDVTLIGPEGAMAFNGLALEGSDSSGLSAAPTDSTISLATLDTSVSSASFKIPAAATLLSDNAPQKVGIATATLPANLQYQAAPKLQEIAFLAAYTANPTDFPFLAGPVSTFLDNTFVTTGSLKPSCPAKNSLSTWEPTPASPSPANSSTASPKRLVSPARAAAPPTSSSSPRPTTNAPPNTLYSKMCYPCPATKRSP